MADSVYKVIESVGTIASDSLGKRLHAQPQNVLRKVCETFASQKLSN